MAVLSALFLWELKTYNDSILKLAAAEARASINKDLVYRRWAAGHGGVYVPVTEESPPNPYLQGIEDRDVTTTSGKKLTLVNPAYMTRQVHESSMSQYGVKGHITSLNPIRPENKPDEWERTALELFEQGVQEVKAVTPIDGEDYYRVMLPMLIEQRCLKCHGYQGYAVGDLRGGISVSVPLLEYKAIAEKNIFVLFAVLASVFCVGVGGLFVAFSSLVSSESRRAIAQRSLVESEEQLQTIFRAADNVAFVMTDLGGEDSRVIGFSPGAEKIFGYTREEIIGQKVSRLHPPGAEKEFPDIQQMLHREEKNYSGETFLVRKSGERFPALFTVQPLVDAAGVLTGTIGVTVDISKRIVAEEQLRKSKDMAYALLDASFEESFLIKPDGTFITVNELTAQTLGRPVQELVGKSIYQILPQDIARSRKEKIDKAILSKNTIRFSDESEGLWFEHSVTPILDSEGNVDCVAVYSRDVTIQRSAEDTMKRDLISNQAVAEISRELLAESYDLQKVSDATLDAACRITDSRHGFVARIEEEALTIIGHTISSKQATGCELKDRPFTLSLGEDGRYGGLWGHALNSGEPFFTNDPLRHASSTGLPDGHIPLVNFLSVPVIIGERAFGLIALANSARDFTEQDLVKITRIAEVFALGIHRQEYEMQRNAMEKSLRQLQKSEAIGALAGGIAHDFNNILSPIIGYAEVLEDDLKEDDPLQESVQQILAAADRARDLVQQILTFSRQHEKEIVPLKPHLILKEVVKLIKVTMPSTIEVRQDIDVDTRTIMADPTQIHQVAMNLLTNAYHAMQDDGGTLTIKLENQDTIVLGDGSIPAEGPWVVLTVEDTGVGMNKDVREKVFDPYFTTKPQGKGTGLGLSVVYGIVKNYGGEIEVESRPGEGSLFRVFLPAVTTTGDQELQQVRVQNAIGDERIMLVDDEVAILDLEKKLLERLGYRVEMFSNSRNALAEIIAHPDKYDMVITDMTMPGLTGDRLTIEIRKTSSTIPILICTGFSEILTPERVTMIGADGMLMKPVAKTDLANKVREILDRKKC